MADLPIESVYETTSDDWYGKITRRKNTVIAVCDAGTYIGDTKAGRVVPGSVHLVRNEQESD